MLLKYFLLVFHLLFNFFQSKSYALWENIFIVSQWGLLIGRQHGGQYFPFLTISLAGSALRSDCPNPFALRQASSCVTFLGFLGTLFPQAHPITSSESIAMITDQSFPAPALYLLKEIWSVLSLKAALGQLSRVNQPLFNMPASLLACQLELTSQTQHVGQCQATATGQCVLNSPNQFLSLRANWVAWQK